MNEYGQWKAKPDGGRWAVRQDSQEVFRITADGVLQHGPKTYWFATGEWAELCARRLNAMDRAVRLGHPSYPVGITWAAGRIFDTGASNLTFNFTDGGHREIFRLDSKGAIKRIDIPYLVWVWLRETPLVRGLKRLWYGEASK